MGIEKPNRTFLITGGHSLAKEWHRSFYNQEPFRSLTSFGACSLHQCLTSTAPPVSGRRFQSGQAAFLEGKGSHPAAEVEGGGQLGIRAAPVQRKSSPRDTSAAAWRAVRGPACGRRGPNSADPSSAGSLPARAPRQPGCPRAAACEPGRGLHLHREVFGRPGGLKSEGSHPAAPPRTFAAPVPSSRSPSGLSSIPSAPLDVFALAPGASPVLVVRNLLLRAP